MEQYLFRRDYCKLFLWTHNNIWLTMMFATKSVVKYTTRK
jgi:putative exporter of polyketide antibiotics